MKQVYFVKWK